MTISTVMRPGGLFRAARYEVTCDEHGLVYAGKSRERATAAHELEVGRHPHWHVSAGLDKKAPTSHWGPFETIDEAVLKEYELVALQRGQGWVTEATYSWDDKLTPMEGHETHLKRADGKKMIIRCAPCLGCGG